MDCYVCGDSEAAEMTTGRETLALCDRCRPPVVTFFHVYGSLKIAADEIRKAKLGGLK